MQQWTPKLIAKEAERRGAKVTPRYVRRLCERGIIKATKPGRDWIISDNEAERWLQEWTKSK